MKTSTSNLSAPATGSLNRKTPRQSWAKGSWLVSKPLKGLCSSLIVLLCLASASGKPAQAEGSRTLYPTASGARGSLLFTTDSYLSTLQVRTIYKVYATAGEYINVGSTAVAAPAPVTVGTTTYSVSTGDIVIYDPSLVSGTIGQETIPATPSFSCNAQRTSTGSTLLGRISSRTQELAGPDTIATAATGARGNAVPTGYVPCYYKVPSTGIYSVIFYPPNRSVSFATGPVGVANGDINMAAASNFDASQSIHVSAWDVTVRPALNSTTENTGRLFSYYTTMRQGANNLSANFSVYPVTLDGYQYRTDMRGLDPNAFIFYGNTSGFFDPDGVTPLYHDVLASGTAIADDFLSGGLVGSPVPERPKFPVFLSTPDSSVIFALGIPSSPTAPVVSPLTFNFLSSLGSNSSFVGQGGNFSYSANVSHTYQIVISRDGINFDPTNSNNRVLRGLKNSGSSTVSWNGLDNSGVAFPVGTNYQSQLFIYAGEYHFPMIDAENSPNGGPTLTLLNPPGTCINSNCKTAFYDDRGYKLSTGTTVGTIGGSVLTTPGTQPTTLFSGPGGFDSSGTQRAYGLSGNGWGDKKGLDTWIYFPSTTVSTPVNIIALRPNLSLAKRITSILRATTTPAEQVTPSTYIDVTSDTSDNSTGWPTLTATATQDTGSPPLTTSNFSTLLQGIVNGSAAVLPNDTVEYRIYFLSNGTMDAKTVALCDFIPKSSSYVPGSLQLVTYPTTTPTTTAITDATGDADGGSYPSTTTTFPSACLGVNNGTGAVLVNLGNIIKSTGSGTASTYGYIRFSTTVK
jgi:uncharacterized repeat protein (TIGR01451 family)